MSLNYTPLRHNDGLLDHATEFQFKLYPDGHEFWDIAEMAITVVWRGPGDRWAVMERGWCYDAQGSREYESIPSDRSDEFKDRFRFTRDEAVRLAIEVAVPQRRAAWDKRTKATP